MGVFDWLLVERERGKCCVKEQRFSVSSRLSFSFSELQKRNIFIECKLKQYLLPCFFLRRGENRSTWKKPKIYNTLEPLPKGVGNSTKVAVGRGLPVSFHTQSSYSYAQLQVESALCFTVIRQFRS